MKDNKLVWVSQLYINRGRFRFIPVESKTTLHESVLLRLQQLQNYRPKNILEICGNDTSAATQKFNIEKWVRL